MTTTVTKKVGSAGTGRDYATIEAAWAAIPTNLVTADQQWILELYKDSNFNPSGAVLTLTGKTTDATRNIIVRPALGQGFRDSLNSTTPFNYNPANGVSIVATGDGGNPLVNLANDYLTFDGIQVDSSIPGPQGAIKHLSGVGTVAKNCIARANAGSSGACFVGTSSSVSFVNCLALAGATGNGFLGGDNSVVFRNCTAIGTGGGYGFRGNYSTPLYLNCSSFSFGTAYANTGNGSNDYNVSDQASAPGAHSLSSKVFANQYVSTTDFRVKAGADLINAGTPDAANTGGKDILNQTRSTTTPTIGAYEYGISAPLTVAGTAPAATVGSSYTTTFTASGGTAPYTYSAVGTLPPGLVINPSTGVLSGTPTTAGTYTFVIHAVDSTP